MKASVLIAKLQEACGRAGTYELEVYHWSGYEPRATKSFYVDLERPDEKHNLYTHYGARLGEDCIVLNVMS